MKNLQILIILLLSVILITCSKNGKVDNKKEEKPSSAAIDQQQKESEKMNSIVGKKLATLKEVVNATAIEIDGYNGPLKLDNMLSLFLGQILRSLT